MENITMEVEIIENGGVTTTLKSKTKAGVQTEFSDDEGSVVIEDVPRECTNSACLGKYKSDAGVQTEFPDDLETLTGEISPNKKEGVTTTLKSKTEAGVQTEFSDDEGTVVIEVAPLDGEDDLKQEIKEEQELNEMVSDRTEISKVEEIVDDITVIENMVKKDVHEFSDFVKDEESIISSDEYSNDGEENVKRDHGAVNDIEAEDVPNGLVINDVISGTLINEFVNTLEPLDNGMDVFNTKSESSSSLLKPQLFQQNGHLRSFPEITDIFFNNKLSPTLQELKQPITDGNTYNEEEKETKVVEISDNSSNDSAYIEEEQEAEVVEVSDSSSNDSTYIEEEQDIQFLEISISDHSSDSEEEQDIEVLEISDNSSDNSIYSNKEQTK